MKRRKKPLKWTFILMSTGTRIKGKTLDDIIISVGENLSSLLRREDVNAYGASRDLIHKKFDIHPMLSQDAAIKILRDKGILSLVRRRSRKPGAKPYHTALPLKDRHGSFVVAIPRDNLQFVIPARSYLSEMLQANLYSVFRPSERTFRFHLASWCTLNHDTPLSTEAMLDLLIKRKIITLTEIVYNVGS